MSVLSWWEREWPRLVGYLRPLAGDDAPDVADEALLRAWLAERRGATVHPTYAYRVARNLAIDLSRRRAFARRRTLAYLAEHPLTAPGPEAEMPADALDGLTEQEHAAVEGLIRGDREKETAADLSITRVAVASARKRGLAKLRRREAE